MLCKKNKIATVLVLCLPIPFWLQRLKQKSQQKLLAVGKINATCHLSKAIAAHRPDFLINYGSAGAIAKGLDGMVEVGSAVQGDMDVRPLGLELGQTPFDSCPATIQLSDSPVRCGSADRFSDTPPELACDIVDMELFALAKIAWHEQIPFRAFKFISDAADDKAAGAWKDRACHLVPALSWNLRKHS